MHTDLRVAGGFQETQAVAETLSRQTELELLLEHRGAALQDHLVILGEQRDKVDRREPQGTAAKTLPAVELFLSPYRKDTLCTSQAPYISLFGWLVVLSFVHFALATVSPKLPRLALQFQDHEILPTQSLE